MRIDTRELARMLQGVGSMSEPLERLLVESYGEAADLRYELARYSGALARFLTNFPETKKVSIARAPAYLNLMGAHTDYNGLPVLTMAIERDVTVMFSPRKDRRINLINTSFWHPPRSFEIAKRIRHYSEGNWGDFGRIAAEVVRDAAADHILGMDACVFGDIPAGTGLASSTALLAALVSALAQANNLSIPAKDLAVLLAGRDCRNSADCSTAAQTAAILCGEPGSVAKIEPFPLSVNLTPMPAGWSLVVCSSLVESSGSSEARSEVMDLRVAECRLGVAVLAEELRDKPIPGRDLTMLAGLRHLSSKRQQELLESLPVEPVSLKEVSKLARIPVPKLRDAALPARKGDRHREPREEFRLRSCVGHVLSEGRRVGQAESALTGGDMELLGRLMNESHKSCSQDYGISTPEIDALADICLEEGAAGARLVGAGLGGCVAALVPDRDVPEFEAAIISRYYHDYLQREHKGTTIGVVALEDAIFPCKPCGGVRVL